MPPKKTTTSRPRPTPPPPAAAEFADLTVEELLAENKRLSAERTAILYRQRELTAELDRRALEQEERRRAEAEVLGQTNRPRPQGVLGDVTNG